MRWLCCLIFFAYACNHSNGYNKLVVSQQDSINDQQRIKRAYISIDSFGRFIRTGDLVTRTGADFTSESLRSLNQRDQRYSHCGICSIENDTVFVYHALGGEWNPDQKIRRDPLSVFGDPSDNNSIGFFRFAINQTQIDSVLSIVKKLHRQGIMFDLDFDLKTDDRMYCAEFVSKSYNRGSQGILKFTNSNIGAFEFIGVDDIFLHPLCREQGRIEYK